MKEMFGNLLNVTYNIGRTWCLSNDAQNISINNYFLFMGKKRENNVTLNASSTAVIFCKIHMQKR